MEKQNGKEGLLIQTDGKNQPIKHVVGYWLRVPSVDSTGEEG